MNKIITLIGFLIFSIHSFAESPVQFSAQDSKEWNKSMDNSSVQVLQKWFEDNSSVGQFGGTNDGVCDSVWISGKATLVNSAYNYPGTYAVLVDGVEGFSKISKAMVNKHDDSIIYLLTENPSNTIFCIKNR